MGSTDWQLLGVLLIGSLPGIAIGSYFAVRVPETALRLLLAGILILVAGRLGAEQWRAIAPNVAAVTDHAPVGRAEPAPDRAGRDRLASGQLIQTISERRL